jgi:hypothetical protein
LFSSGGDLFILGGDVVITVLNLLLQVHQIQLLLLVALDWVQVLNDWLLLVKVLLALLGLEVLHVDLLEQLEVVLDPVFFIESLNFLDQWFDILFLGLSDDLSLLWNNWHLLHPLHLLLLLVLELIHQVLLWETNETI